MPAGPGAVLSVPVTDPSDTPADSTRAQIIRAAAHQFAVNAYSSVSLDDIVAAAGVTKGALYFHFPSKRALAEALIDERAKSSEAAVIDLINRRMSGLETLIDTIYLVAAQEFGTELGRASVNLLDSSGRIEGKAARRLNQWVAGMTPVVQRAIDEGDLLPNLDAADVARLIITLYAGTRSTTDLTDTEQFLPHMAKSWNLILPAIVNPERLAYLTEFIRRRTAHVQRDWSRIESDPF